MKLGTNSEKEDCKRQQNNNFTSENWSVDQIKSFLQEWADFTSSKKRTEIPVKDGMIVCLFPKPCPNHTIGSSYETKLKCKNCLAAKSYFSLHFTDAGPEFFLLNPSTIKYSTITLNQPQIREPFTKYLMEYACISD